MCDECTALRARVAELERVIEEVASCGVSMSDERLDYVEIQIDCDTWREVKEIKSKAKEPKR